MPDLTRRSIGEGIDFLPIANHQFKTGLLTVSLHLPLQKEAAAQNAILPQLLTRTCRAYPDMTALNEKLAQLYGEMCIRDRPCGAIMRICVRRRIIGSRPTTCRRRPSR